MFKNLFLRNIRAADYLELFLVSAISSLLLVRFFLAITGYPQVGGDELHIAHMLWGGFLMLIAMILMMAFLGSRIQRVAAIIGGIGFGVFIDEIGKFITHDNNYFYQPAIALIYAIFIVLFLIFRYLSRKIELKSKEYVLNALVQLEDAVLDDMDTSEKKRVLALLRQADETTPLTQDLLALLPNVRSYPTKETQYLLSFRTWIDKTYSRLLHMRYANRTVKLFFILEASLFLAGVSLLIINTLVDLILGYKGLDNPQLPIIIGEVISVGIAAVFVFLGVLRFPQSRLSAYQYFQQATIVQIFLTEFFVFYREQFGALPFFLFNLFVFIALRTIIRAEERLRQKSS
ncbi:hypothetical protein CYG49_02595 [Candidatus Saccharibacteria bacterium]|nr:MAG: hypothetical protein CYG49_02595 [Candidatus Saccharibacteria bacterium]